MELITCYLKPFIFYETLPAIAYFVTNNISMKLSPERNHLPKAQMELPCYKSHMEGRNHIELFPYWKINFPQLGIDCCLWV